MLNSLIHCVVFGMYYKCIYFEISAVQFSKILLSRSWLDLGGFNRLFKKSCILVVKKKGSGGMYEGSMRPRSSTKYLFPWVSTPLSHATS